MLRTTRFAAIRDGVFAFAITLLVLLIQAGTSTALDKLIVKIGATTLATNSNLNKASGLLRECEDDHLPWRLLHARYER